MKKVVFISSVIVAVTMIILCFTEGAKGNSRRAELLAVVILGVIEGEIVPCIPALEPVPTEQPPGSINLGGESSSSGRRHKCDCNTCHISAPNVSTKTSSIRGRTQFIHPTVRSVQGANINFNLKRAEKAFAEMDDKRKSETVERIRRAYGPSKNTDAALGLIKVIAAEYRPKTSLPTVPRRIN